VADFLERREMIERALRRMFSFSGRGGKEETVYAVSSGLGRAHGSTGALWGAILFSCREAWGT